MEHICQRHVKKHIRQLIVSKQSFSESKHKHPSYLLQLSTPGSHEHHRVLAVGVRRHGAHALSAVLVQRVPLDGPQASQRLVQHQSAEIVSDLLRLWMR